MSNILVKGELVIQNYPKGITLSNTANSRARLVNADCQQVPNQYQSVADLLLRKKTATESQSTQPPLATIGRHPLELPGAKARMSIASRKRSVTARPTVLIKGNYPDFNNYIFLDNFL